MIEIVIRGTPVAKGRPRFARETGHAYTPEKTRNFEAVLRLAAGDVMGDRPPLTGPIRLEMNIVLPVPKSWPKRRKEGALAGRYLPVKKPDFDNYAKVVDGCNQIVWLDDGQVVDGRVRKRYGAAPGTWIYIWPLGDDDGWLYENTDAEVFG